MAVVFLCSITVLVEVAETDIARSKAISLTASVTSGKLLSENLQ